MRRAVQSRAGPLAALIIKATLNGGVPACRFFETFSFLPPLDDGEISRQVEYIIANGWTPCLEFAEQDCAYVKSVANIRFGNSASAVRSFHTINAIVSGLQCAT